MRPAFAHWLDTRQGNEPIYVYFGGRLSFQYYLDLFGADRCLTITPADACPVDTVIYGKWFDQQPDQVKFDSIKNSLPPDPPSFWLFLTGIHGQDDALILDWLQAEYNMVDQTISRGVQLYRFERK